MSKFEPFKIALGGADRTYFIRAIFPIGTYNTSYTYEKVTFKYGKLPLVFSDCDFTNVTFNLVDLRYALFLNCTFFNCRFIRCQLDFVTMLACHGAELSFSFCSLPNTLLSHLMIDGLKFIDSDLSQALITVNTEYLAPILIRRCLMDSMLLTNNASAQYAGLFGTPVLSTDKHSVKIDKCRGKGTYTLVGFQYACER